MEYKIFVTMLEYAWLGCLWDLNCVVEGADI